MMMGSSIWNTEQWSAASTANRDRSKWATLAFARMKQVSSQTKISHVTRGPQSAHKQLQLIKIIHKV